MPKQPADLNSRDLALLDPAFRPRVDELLANCAKSLSPRGGRIGVHCTLIGPRREAALYAQSRRWEDVRRLQQTMHAAGAPRLAALFVPAMCLGKPWASSALPGRSWHSWGQAIDCHIIGPTGKALWGGPNETADEQALARFGYQTYADTARAMGLTSGHYWAARDSVHVQMPPGAGIILPWPQVEARMLQGFDF